MSTQPINKLLMQFALPSIISMCVTSVYNLCDTIFIGQVVGPLAIAGLAIAFPLMNISTAFRLLSSVGGAAQTSLHMGRNDRKGARRIFGNVMAMSFLVSVVLMTVGLWLLDPILSLFGASSAVLPYAHEYTKIYLWGMPVAHLFFAMTSQMRSVGHPKTSMYFLVGSVVLNVALDALFILMFGWGIKGAAYATFLSQAIGMIGCLIFFSLPNHYVRLSLEGLKLNFTSVRNIVSIGISPFSIQLSGCLIVIVINNALMSHGGTDGDFCVGAYGIMYRVSQIMILVVSGFAQGMQPLVGFNAGAGLIDRVYAVLGQSLRIATAVMAVGYMVIFIWAEEVAGFLTDDPELIRYCAGAMRIALCIYPLVGSQMIATTYFNSIGRARLSMITSLSRMWVFLLPLLLILPQKWGIDGIWWSMSLADCCSVLLAWILLGREVRRGRKIKAY